MASTIEWLSLPEEHDYPAAQSYLTLVFPPAKAAAYVRALRKAKMTGFKAKDIFRASALSLLGVSNSHVDKDRAKIDAGKHLSPLLLVRHPATAHVIVADGYDRLCAVYAIDEAPWIPLQIL